MRASGSKEAGISAATTRHRYLSSGRVSTSPSPRATRTCTRPSAVWPGVTTVRSMGRVPVAAGGWDGPASGSSPSRSSGSRNRVSSSTRAVATTCFIPPPPPPFCKFCFSIIQISPVLAFFRLTV